MPKRFDPTNKFSHPVVSGDVTEIPQVTNSPDLLRFFFGPEKK